jgi:hypothetical protein
MTDALKFLLKKLLRKRLEEYHDGYSEVFAKKPGSCFIEFEVFPRLHNL